MSRPSWTTVERSVRFVLGVVLVIWEATVPPAPRPELLAVALGLLGLPDMLRLDQWLARARREDPDEADREKAAH